MGMIVLFNELFEASCLAKAIGFQGLGFRVSLGFLGF